MSRTVLDLAAQRKRAVAVEDAVEDRVLRQARSVVRNQLRAVAVAPVMIGGEVAGFLHVDRERPQYAADDAALLECFAAAFALGGHLRARTSAPVPAPPPSRVAARPRRPADAPIGVSAAWRAALHVADASAAAASTVLITGESGTGKEEIASYLHRRSTRAARTVRRRQLRRDRRDAGGERAVRTREGRVHGIDGVAHRQHRGGRRRHAVPRRGGRAAAAIQVKLLRVLQERVFCRVGSTVPRRVDVRFVAATHRDLDADVRGGRFREDLFYRLAVIRIKVPPLRERPEDVEPLARVLLARTAAALGRRDPGIADGALDALRRWRWPGNVRELGNVLERALVLAGARRRGNRSRATRWPRRSTRRPRELSVAAGGTLASKVDALERAEIETALRKARGVKARAAQALGLSRPTLDKKLADLDIDVWRDGKKT